MQTLTSRGLRVVIVAVVATALTLTASCSGGSDDLASPSTSASATTGAETTTPAAEATSTSAAAGATAGGDDLNQDGEPDPVCGTRDFKAGLVLKVPCDAAAYASEPSEGTTLVPDSLYSMPSVSDDVKADVLSEASADGIRGRDEKNKEVVVLFIKSDTLFEVGSATLSEPARATLDGLIRGIQKRFAAAPIQVRGHTDATGSVAANQTLSEQRAANVAAYLAAHGIDKARLSSIGLASTLPVALEKNPDGSDNPNGRRENRRVELVLRLP